MIRAGTIATVMFSDDGAPGGPATLGVLRLDGSSGIFGAAFGTGRSLPKRFRLTRRSLVHPKKAAPPRTRASVLPEHSQSMRRSRVSFEAAAQKGSHRMRDIADAVVLPRAAPPAAYPSPSPAGLRTSDHLARPHAPPKLRVGFLTPFLLFGGVEHWLLSLLRYSDRQLTWSGVVTNPT